MDKLLGALAADYPGLAFEAGNTFCWSPANKRVIYKRGASGQSALYSLLHEVGHGLLGHQRYRQDFELIQLEVAAWDKARQIAGNYGLEISDDHIQDCLDSYRDWQFRRSICPVCSAKA
jgi:hypothetical protein